MVGECMRMAQWSYMWAASAVVLLVAGGGWRQMVCVDPDSGTLCLNAATVPRVVQLPHSNGERVLRTAPRVAS
jgi:hypothetical protein